MPNARSPGLLPLLVILWAVLGAVSARYDLAISRAVVDPGAAWARAGERYGTLPGVYAIAIAAVLAFARHPLRSERRLPLAGWWLTCSAAVTFAIAISLYRLGGYRVSVARGGSLFGVVALVSFACRWRWPRALQLGQRTWQSCTWTLILGVMSWLLVYAAKAAWGRVRYRDLDPLGQHFTPWFLPQGLTGHASFPSGHAAMGWVLLPCILLWPAKSMARRAAAVVCVAWGAFVAASRVVIGAHYLSDVSFPTALAVTVMLFALQEQQQQGADDPVAPSSPAASARDAPPHDP